jgi:hypothetical protein
MKGLRPSGHDGGAASGYNPDRLAITAGKEADECDDSSV